MARVPLIDEHASPDIAAVVGEDPGARGGRLLNFYRALLHAPRLASAWLDFNNAVRFQTGLGDRVRELIIMRVAALNGADYVFDIHRSRYAEPAGVTPGAGRSPARLAQVGTVWPGESALLAYVDAMTRDVAVAGCRVQGTAGALQRAGSRGAHGAGRRLQHAYPGAEGARR